MPRSNNDEDDAPTDGEDDGGTWEGMLPRGLKTFWGRVQSKQERREDRADDRVDKAYAAALRGRDRTIVILGLLGLMLLMAVLVLAGNPVGLDIPGVGSFTGGATP